MTTAAWALQKAVYGALVADSALSGLLGGEHVFDHVPRARLRPLVTFSVSRERDWSTASDIGHEHEIALDVWSEGRGREQVQAIVSAIHQVLHDRELVLDGHRLVNLRHTSGEVRREADGETWRGTTRFRAVTEVLG